MNLTHPSLLREGTGTVGSPLPLRGRRLQQEATKGASLFLRLLGSILVSYPGMIAHILQKLIHQMVRQFEPIFLFHRFRTRLGAFLRKLAHQKILCYWRQTMHIHLGLLLKRGTSHPGVVVVEVRPLNLDMAIGRPIGLGVLGFLTHPNPSAFSYPSVSLSRSAMC